MTEQGINAWIAPSADPHQSEYVAEHWQVRAWLSGFTGSAGTLIVTQKECGLWTDARYHIRAAAELTGSGIALFREGSPTEWLKQNLPTGSTIGFDGSVLSMRAAEQLSTSFRLAGQTDLISDLWKDRPPLPRSPVFLHTTEFAGEPRASKIQRVREQGEAQLVTALDDIAWLLNIRGSDIAYHPVAISYILLSANETRLFIAPEKIPPKVKAELQNDGVQISNYSDVAAHLQQLPAGTTLLIDPEKTNFTLAQHIPKTCQIQHGQSIPARLKAIKNETETGGLRRAHIRDGVAVVKWMHWLEQAVQTEAHTEISLADQLTQFRSEGDHFRGLSFATITGYQANSAVGHYCPDPATTPHIHPTGILLSDSGGHYLDGTTDITRTLSLGNPTPRQRHIFTTVLKSLIRLTSATFPKGTTGAALDAIAREPLWHEGWNCRHSIGHGIGAFLNVHEGPQRLAPGCNIPLEKGMAVTVEPGVYMEGVFGVRLENVLLVREKKAPTFGNFLGFETLTLCPIDTHLIDTERLTTDERAWLNTYHRHVDQTLAPHLSAKEQRWLRHKTADL